MPYNEIRLYRAELGELTFFLALHGEDAGSIRLEWGETDFRDLCQRAIKMVRAIVPDGEALTVDLFAKHWYSRADQYTLYDTVRDLDTDMTPNPD